MSSSRCRPVVVVVVVARLLLLLYLCVCRGPFVVVVVVTLSLLLYLCVGVVFLRIVNFVCWCCLLFCLLFCLLIYFVCLFVATTPRHHDTYSTIIVCVVCIDDDNDGMKI